MHLSLPGQSRSVLHCRLADHEPIVPVHPLLRESLGHVQPSVAALPHPHGHLHESDVEVVQLVQRFRLIFPPFFFCLLRD